MGPGAGDAGETGARAASERALTRPGAARAPPPLCACVWRPWHQSILSAFWWALVTMTTVGYGDVYPVTTAGKSVAAVTMITGLLVIAFPITIIGVNLNDIYEEFREEKAKKARALARSRVKDLARVRDETTTTNAMSDLASAIDELISVQHRMHEELDAVRGKLQRLMDYEIHAEAMLEHLKKANEANKIMQARARAKVIRRAGLDDEETVPIMPDDSEDLADVSNTNAATGAASAGAGTGTSGLGGVGASSLSSDFATAGIGAFGSGYGDDDGEDIGMKLIRSMSTPKSNKRS